MKRIERPGETAAPLAFPGAENALPALPDAPVALGPWVGFHSRKSARAAEVAAKLPGISEGQAYLWRRDQYRLLDGAAYAIVDAFGFFANYNPTSNLPDRVFLQESTESRAVLPKVQENIITLGLVLQRDGEIAAVTCSWRGAKCRAVRQHLAACAESEKPEWLAQHAAAAQVPPRFRVLSTVTTLARTARSGFVYHEATAHPVALSAEQAMAITQWWARSDSQAEWAAVALTHKNRVDEARKKAGAAS